MVLRCSVGYRRLIGTRYGDDLNSSEPLGLPRGSVRALISLAITASVVYLWVSGQPVAGELLIAWGAVAGLYFSTRGRVTTPQEEALADPVLGDDPGDGAF